jgi:hypothetical protein
MLEKQQLVRTNDSLEQQRDLAARELGILVVDVKQRDHGKPSASLAAISSG